MRRFGAVITFKAGTSEEYANRILKGLFDSGHIDAGGYYDKASGTFKSGPPKANGFDDRVGGPVWYIP